MILVPTGLVAGSTLNFATRPIWSRGQSPSAPLEGLEYWQKHKAWPTTKTKCSNIERDSLDSWSYSGRMSTEGQSDLIVRNSFPIDRNPNRSSILLLRFQQHRPAPASIEFSTTPWLTLAGRSITSPASIWLARLWQFNTCDMSALYPIFHPIHVVSLYPWSTDLFS